ncbi:MAG: hypothetical protein Q7R87_03830 [Nanoarchaeota archaeon]|nr:hypothetical protein [Nanoarchaeota archaeon]
MNKLPLFLTLLGILALILILNLSQPIEINSQEDLLNLTQNQKVQVSGKVIEQKDYDKITFLTLNNNLNLTYSGKYFNFLEKDIRVTGTYDNYNYPKIKILELKIK